MNELLKGRISDADGLKEVLELVATFNEANNAVLEIDSETVCGRIGFAWGKFITGALVTEPEEKGRKALLVSKVPLAGVEASNAQKESSA